MNKFQQQILEIIKSERNYDKSFFINGISKSTDNTIVCIAEELNLEYEEAAEYLIQMGSTYHYGLNNSKL